MVTKKGVIKENNSNDVLAILLSLIFLIMAWFMILGIFFGWISLYENMDVRLSPLPYDNDNVIFGWNDYGITQEHYNTLNDEDKTIVESMFSFYDEEYYTEGREASSSLYDDIEMSRYDKITISEVPEGGRVWIEFSEYGKEDYYSVPGTLIKEGFGSYSFYVMSYLLIIQDYDFRIIIDDLYGKQTLGPYKVSVVEELSNEIQLSPEDGGITTYPPQAEDYPETEDPNTIPGELTDPLPEIPEEHEPCSGPECQVPEETEEDEVPEGAVIPPEDFDYSTIDLGDFDTEEMTLIPRTVTAGGSTPTTAITTGGGEKPQPWCSCESIKVIGLNGEGEDKLWLNIPKVEKGSNKGALGFIELKDQNDDNIGVSLGFEVQIELEPGSNPKLCVEGQHVKRETRFNNGNIYASVIDSKGNIIKDQKIGRERADGTDEYFIKSNEDLRKKLGRNDVSLSSNKISGTDHIDDNYKKPGKNYDYRFGKNSRGGYSSVDDLVGDLKDKLMEENEGLSNKEAFSQALKQLDYKFSSDNKAYNTKKSKKFTSKPTIAWHDTPSLYYKSSLKSKSYSKQAKSHDMSFVSHVKGAGNKDGKKAKSCYATFNIKISRNKNSEGKIVGSLDKAEYAEKPFVGVVQ